MAKFLNIFFVFLALPVLLFGAGIKQDFETVKVADGIYGFIASESISGVVQGNIILVVGENSAMLIDSGQYPSLAERVALKVSELTDKPVRLLVNTHWHGDHLLANHVFKKHFPGILVVMHEETAKNAEKFYANFADQVKGYPELIEKLRKAAKTGKTSKGVPLTEEQREGFTIDADWLEPALKDFTESHYEAPEMTFQKELSFDLGKRKVRILNLGRGNTSGDAIILIPDAKVLATGDTVVYPTPYSFGSYHSEWIEVLKMMMTLGAETYIPGHGPVMHDTSYIQKLIALMEDVRTQVRAAVKENLTLEQVREKVKLEEWNQKFAADNKDRQRAFREFFVAPGIERAYKEAKGETLTEE